MGSSWIFTARFLGSSDVEDPTMEAPMAQKLGQGVEVLGLEFHTETPKLSGKSEDLISVQKRRCCVAHSELQCKYT